ncbi:MAG: hypothetical protein JXA60_01760 [Candidatus Coatesbacteria bacterium]|nr:hypothetical protein [Candidatus Coatesbacteria bacterium]
MKVLLFLILLVGTAGLIAEEVGDRVASYPLPAGYMEEQQISGLAVVKGKIYVTNLTTHYIVMGDVNTGTWEKSWLFTQDIYTYGMSVSNSADTMALVGNETKQLFLLDLNSDDLDILGSVLLDESVVQETNPPYLTGVLYITYNSNYRVLVVDRDNLKLYEVDPIALEYKGKTNAPADIAYAYWLRGLGYDKDVNCILFAISCFNEELLLDSSMVSAYDPATWARKTELAGDGHFLPFCSIDTLGQGNWFDGVYTYMNIRGIAYINDFTSSQTEWKKVYPAAGMENPGVCPQAVWMYLSFGFDSIKKTTWGGIKKMYGEGVSFSRKPGSAKLGKTAIRDIKASKVGKSRLILPKRSNLR